MKHVHHLTLLAVAVVPICIAGCTHGGTEQIDEFAPVAVQVGREEIDVIPSNDSVTVVLNVQDDAAQPLVLYATYANGLKYRATDAHGVAPGKVASKRIPWHPHGLAIGPSRTFQVNKGDIVVVRYPTDYMVGGWLRR